MGIAAYCPCVRTYGSAMSDVLHLLFSVLFSILPARVVVTIHEAGR
jgi:hypothetical protein